MKKSPRTRRRLGFSDAGKDDTAAISQFPALRRVSEAVASRTAHLYRPITGFLSVVILISTIQWACIQFLANYCAKWSWAGPLTNILSLGSPACNFVNHVQVTLADHYVTLWAGALGATIAFISSHVTVSTDQPKKCRRGT